MEKNHNVMAKVVFFNKSDHDYFIYRGGLPSTAGDIFFGIMCGSYFRITADNIKLDYLGHSCDFGNDLEKNREKIKPGRKLKFTVWLNLAYEFLPENHQYQIGTLEYGVVTKEWFSEVIAKRTMFRILERRAECPIKTDLPLMTELQYMCPQSKSGERVNDLSSILEDIGFDGGNSKNYFRIRSNQVSISVNADKETSYYQYLRKMR